MNFALRDEDRPLIEAAIQLGDWLLTQEVTPEQVRAIRWLQDALRRLPRPTLGMDAEYGFRVVDADLHAWNGIGKPPP